MLWTTQSYSADGMLNEYCNKILANDTTSLNEASIEAGIPFLHNLLPSVRNFINPTRIEGLSSLLCELPLPNIVQDAAKDEGVNNICRDLMIIHQPIPLFQVPLPNTEDSDEESSEETIPELDSETKAFLEILVEYNESLVRSITHKKMMKAGGNYDEWPVEVESSHSDEDEMMVDTEKVEEMKLEHLITVGELTISVWERVSAVIVLNYK